MFFTAGILAAFLNFAPTLQTVPDVWTEQFIPLEEGQYVKSLAATDDDLLYLLLAHTGVHRLLRFDLYTGLPPVVAFTLPPSEWNADDLVHAPGETPGGGHLVFHSSAGFRHIDLSTGQLGFLPPPPASLNYSWPQDMAASPSELYAVFSEEFAPTLRFHAFSWETGAWVSLTPPDVAGGIVTMAWSPAFGGSIYLVRRYPNVGEVLRYDIGDDRWESSSDPGSAIAPMPGGGPLFIGSGPGGSIYGTAHDTLPGLPAAFYRFDPAPGTWTRLTSLPLPSYEGITRPCWPGAEAPRLHQISSPESSSQRFWIYGDPHLTGSPGPSTPPEPSPPGVDRRSDSGGCHGAIAGSWMAGAALAGLLLSRRPQ